MPKRERPLRKNGKKMSVRAAFGERMKREGRYKEWMARAKQIAQENGRGLGNSLWIAMKEFGYEGPKTEWNKYWDWVEQERDKTQREKEQVKAERKDMDWNAAIAELPDSAPTSVEMNWVRAHEAMTRIYRSPKGESIVITADDLLGAEHGPCPSKPAANLLQNYVNRPDKFFDMVMTEHKKKTDGGEGSSEVVEDAGTEDIERMLADLKTSIKN